MHGDSTGPTNSARSEKGWEPLVQGHASNLRDVLCVTRASLIVDKVLKSNVET